MNEQPNPKYVHRRLEEHSEVHEAFDSRISRNEEWRLQMQGALKFAAFALGSGVVTAVVLFLIGVV